MFTATKAIIAEALTLAGSTIQSNVKAGNPVLGCYLFEGDGTTLWITGIDPSMSLTLISSVDMACTEFNFCLPAKQFSNLVGLLGGEFHVSLDNGRAIIKHGRSKYKLPYFPGSEFPETPAISGPSITIKANLFKRLISAVDMARDTKTDGKFIALQGLLFSVRDGSFDLVASDAVRIAAASGLMEGQFEILIPGSAASAFSKFSDCAGDVEIVPMENHVCLRSERGLVISRKLVGKFPNWEMAMPKNQPYRAIASAGALTLALKRLGVTSNERDSLEHPALTCKFIFKKDEIVIESRSPDRGEGEEVVEVTSYGVKAEQETIVGVAGRQVLEFLDVIDDGDVNIAYADGTSPLVLSPVRSMGFAYRYLTNQVRLTW